MSLALRIAVTCGAASLQAVMAPPTNLHQIHWFAYLPMFWVLQAERTRANVALGYLYGVVSVAVIFRWLIDTIALFSNLPMILAIAVLLLFSAAFGATWPVLWGAVHPLRRRLGIGWILAFPALQVVLEWVSMWVMLFPYNQGVTQYRVPMTWQIVSVTGIYGSTYLVLLVNAVWAEALYRRREQRPFPWLASGLVLSTLATVMAFGRWRFERIELQLRQAEVLRVAQLQSPTGMVERMQGSAREAFDEWIRLTDTLEQGSADLVIWPEGACPYNLNREEGRANRAADVLSEMARTGGYHLVVGGGTRQREVDPSMGETRVEVFNSVYWFDDAGEALARYDKVVPLPFGEYLPFGDYVPWLSDMIGGIGDFKAGEEATVFEADGLRVATPICYEAILPEVCRWFERPNLFVNVTNDAWFGDTAAPHQHAMLAAIRATELGVPLVRSGYTGVSFVVEPHGVIHSETRPFEQVHRIVSARHATVPTLYARFGDWFVALCLLGLVGGWLGAPRLVPAGPGAQRAD